MNTRREFRETEKKIARIKSNRNKAASRLNVLRHIYQVRRGVIEVSVEPISGDILVKPAKGYSYLDVDVLFDLKGRVHFICFVELNEGVPTLRIF